MAGLFIRRLLYLSLLSLATLGPLNAHASPEVCGPWGIADSEAIGYALTPQGVGDYWLHPCRDVQCRAARDLTCAYDAQLRRDVPNSMGRGDPRSYDRDLIGYNATLRNLGRTHPERRGLYCRLLARVAACDEDRMDHAIQVTRWTTELAARLTRPGFDCIGQVMASLPHAAALAPVVDDAREICTARKYPLCERIVQPPVPDRPQATP
jgi:hypothetical protein